MTKIPKRLKKEPLIEAIWSVQFEPDNRQAIGDLLPGILYTALRDKKYPNLQLQRLPPADIPPQVAQLDSNLRYMPKYRMIEENSPFMFQVGDRIIALNCRSYPGWSDFQKEIIALVEIIKKSGLVPVPSRHSLRYIDLLTLDKAPDLSALRISLTLGEIDTKAKPFQMRIEVQDETKKCAHVVQIITPAQAVSQKGNQEGSIVDLESFHLTQPTAWDDIAEQIVLLHERSKTLFFENLLTESAIDLMEPEPECQP